jgi:hypothetical protein|tara:strand:+ start:720 stop:2459 length:1740 start_codon:yes stop_codon:yes gene_type:complete
MNQKFKSLFLSFIISLLFSNNVYSLNSPCELFPKAVINADKPGLELSLFSVTKPSVKIKKLFNTTLQEYEWVRDKNGNLIVGKIYDFNLIWRGAYLANSYMAKWAAKKLDVKDKDDYIKELEKLAQTYDVKRKIIADLSESSFSSNEYEKELKNIMAVADKMMQHKGLKIGDKISKINGKKVSKLTDEQLNTLIGDYNSLEETLVDSKFEFEFFIERKNWEDKFYDEVSRIPLQQTYATSNIKINNISEINSKNNTFNADLEINTEWKIYNLYPLYEKNAAGIWCSFNKTEWEEMGIGTIYVKNINAISEDENLIEESFVTLDSKYTFWYKEGDTPFIKIQHKKNGNFTIFNKFDLKAYPFDRQKLKIQLADISIGRNIENLNLNYDNYTAYRLKEFEDKNDIIEWNIKSTEINNFNYIDSTSLQVSSGIELILDVDRNYQYYLSKVIFPITLILMICWSVFWIHPREIESKLTITIVCLLSLIAYNFVIDEDLPKLGYLTIIDYIILLSYVFATLPNFLTIWTFHLERSGDQVKWVKIDKLSRTLGPVLFLFLVFAIVMSQVIGNENAAALFGFLRYI